MVGIYGWHFCSKELRLKSLLPKHTCWTGCLAGTPVSYTPLIVYSIPRTWTRTRTRTQGIYFRPKVIYNAGTSKYVLWINRLAPAKNPLAAYPNATYLVATADHPAGSVTLHTRSTNLDVLEASDGVARHAIRCGWIW